MKVIVAGSRAGVVYAQVVAAIELSGWQDQITEVVCGGCRGVDNMGRLWTQGRETIRVVLFQAQWEQYGRAAGPIRNRRMAEYADALVAVWDGRSRGTKNMIETMRELSKPVFVYSSKEAPPF